MPVARGDRDPGGRIYRRRGWAAGCRCDGRFEREGRIGRKLSPRGAPAGPVRFLDADGGRFGSCGASTGGVLARSHGLNLPTSFADPASRLRSALGRRLDFPISGAAGGGSDLPNLLGSDTYLEAYRNAGGVTRRKSRKLFLPAAGDGALCGGAL
ncbi:protein of unknown function [Methylacidimicrobium sp. AP8]|nr:protein of unknown function [Methylacidimicrobium sp. AP8]